MAGPQVKGFLVRRSKPAAPRRNTKKIRGL
jgi:hypothetical protein